MHAPNWRTLNGEYGHGAHRLTAAALLLALNASGDAAAFPESVTAYGTWQVKKCYLHLYGRNAITMNWRQPLSRFNGQTALDMARRGFTFHQSQVPNGRKVYESGKYDCARFGLAYTQVGLDTGINDFFENIS